MRRLKEIIAVTIDIEGSKKRTVLIRTTEKAIVTLDKIAASRHITRSSVIRNLLANPNATYPFLESESAAQKPEVIEHEEKLAEMIIESLPKEYATPGVAYMSSRVMRRVAAILLEREESEKLAKDTANIPAELVTPPFITADNAMHKAQCELDQERS